MPIKRSNSVGSFLADVICMWLGGHEKFSVHKLFDKHIFKDIGERVMAESAKSGSNFRKHGIHYHGSIHAVERTVFVGINHPNLTALYLDNDMQTAGNLDMLLCRPGRYTMVHTYMR